MPRKNPRVGQDVSTGIGYKQPDLFGGESGVYRALSDMTEDEIRSTPRANFSDDEWNALDEDTQDYIYEHDKYSESRIEVYKAALRMFDPDWYAETYEEDPDSYQEILEADLDAGNTSDEELLRLAERCYQGDDFDEVFEGKRNALVAALRNYHNYELTTHVTRGERAAFEWEAGESQADVDIYDFKEAGDGTTSIADIYLRGLYFEDEMEYAIRQMKFKVPDELLPSIKLVFEFRGQRGATEHFKNRGGQVYYSIYYTPDKNVRAYIDWEKVHEEVEEAEPDVEEEVTPIEERVVAKLSDGFYVVDLLASELPEEGRKMGICVGRGDMPYMRLVRQGKTKIYSLRKPNGETRFTIEASLNRHGEVEAINQVKGKANRLPGFADTSREGKFKEDEVKKVLEFLDTIDIDAHSVSDMRPALRAMEEKKALPPKKNPEYDSSLPHGHPRHCEWCARAVELSRR